MKRYYACDLIGDGSMDDPYRPAIADYGANYVAAYPPQDVSTGAYQGSHVLVLVNAVNHTKLMADAGADVLPDFPLDGKLSAMRTTTLKEMNTMLEGRGFSVTWGNADGYRDVIRSVGQQLDPNFHEDNFDVAESA